MAFFTGLISFFLVYWGLSLILPIDLLNESSAKAAFAAGSMFVLIGISHFAKPEKIEKMLEGMTRHARLANYISGAYEIIFGIGLFFAQTRVISAFALILLMFAVFPANINVARKRPTVYNVSRLFFQPVYIAWLWWCTAGYSFNSLL